MRVDTTARTICVPSNQQFAVRPRFLPRCAILTQALTAIHGVILDVKSHRCPAANSPGWSPVIRCAESTSCSTIGQRSRKMRRPNNTAYPTAVSGLGITCYKGQTGTQTRIVKLVKNRHIPQRAYKGNSDFCG
jgi:hypothetical protein